MPLAFNPATVSKDLKGMLAALSLWGLGVILALTVPEAVMFEPVDVAVPGQRSAEPGGRPAPHVVATFVKLAANNLLAVLLLFLGLATAGTLRGAVLLWNDVILGIVIRDGIAFGLDTGTLVLLLVWHGPIEVLALVWAGAVGLRRWSVAADLFRHGRVAPGAMARPLGPAGTHRPDPPGRHH